MPRLRNQRTGVLVDVDDETAAGLTDGWVSADEPVKRKPGRPRKQQADESDD